MEKKTKRFENENPFSDFDFLLLCFSFSSYVSIRFLVESGWIFGFVLFASAFYALKRSANIRHTIYLYSILLFTSPEEQKWLMKKFSLSSKVFSNFRDRTFLHQHQVLDVLNKVIQMSWNFTKSFLEKKLQDVVEEVVFHVNDQRLNPFLQHLIDLKPRQLTLGSTPPVVESVDVVSSNRSDILVVNISFQYICDGCLQFLTRLKHISVENLKIKGQLRAEIGPLTSFPPFVRGMRAFMPEEPNINFTVSNFPDKLESLAKIMSLEKISSKVVIPNMVILPVPSCDISIYLPTGVIFVHVVEAKYLPREVFSQSDPYCVVQLGAKRVVTETIKNNSNPVWSFKTQMMCYCNPSSGGLNMSFSIFDRDVIVNDCMFRTKLNVRRIKEEKCIDEWLFENEEENTSEKSKPTLRIQAHWQDLTKDCFITEETQESRQKRPTDQDLTLSDERNSMFSNADEAMLTDHSPEIRPKDRKDTFFMEPSSKAILFVWIETAEKLKPNWDDFMVKVTFGEQVERTSLVPRDYMGRWPFRHGFSFALTSLHEGEINLEVIAGSHEKGAGHISLKVPSIIEDSYEDLHLKTFCLASKKEEKLDSYLKLTYTLKGIEPLSKDFVKAVKSAENETQATVDSVDTEIEIAKEEKEATKTQVKAKSSQKSRSHFHWGKIEWDACSPFMNSVPFSNGEDAYTRKALSILDGSSGRLDSKEGGHVPLQEVEEKEQTSTSREVTRFSRWSKLRNSKKFSKHK